MNGEDIVPWVMNGEIWLCLFLHIKGFTFPYKEWKLHHKLCEYIFTLYKDIYYKPIQIWMNIIIRKTNFLKIFGGVFVH